MGDICAYVAETEIHKDRSEQIQRIKHYFPDVKDDNIWGQGRKKYRSCSDVRYILDHALRPGDTFVIPHLFQISERRDVILDTLTKFHEANVQLAILDIRYHDQCACDPPKSGHFHLYSRILKAYTKLQESRHKQKEEERLQKLLGREKIRQAKPGHPGKPFEQYDSEIRNAVRFYVQSQGTINERTQEEVLAELQKNHRISMPTFRRIVRKYKEYLARTHKSM